MMTERDIKGTVYALTQMVGEGINEDGAIPKEKLQIIDLVGQLIGQAFVDLHRLADAAEETLRLLDDR